VIGRVVLDKGAQVIDSVVRGPAIIGEGTKIVNSYVGPFTSIYHGVEILNSEVEHSIILENSKILDAPSRIEDSLIGKDVVIRRTATMPKALRFMLGDHSEVDLI
jgi:glucose-1-phosphate thymidylyltransferase